MTLREQFFSMGEVPVEQVRLAVGTIYVRGMTAKERSEYDAQFRLASGKPNRRKQLMARALMVVQHCEDEDGNKLFTESDLATIEAMPAAVIEPIVDAACRVSGMTAEDVDEAAKNSDEADSGN